MAATTAPATTTFFTTAPLSDPVGRAVPDVGNVALGREHDREDRTDDRVDELPERGWRRRLAPCPLALHVGRGGELPREVVVVEVVRVAVAVGDRQLGAHGDDAEA